MNGRVFFWSLTSALAGFLFGFDTVVISGAEKTIQSLWGLSPGLHALPWLPPSRKLHALDLRRLAYDFLPEDGLCVSTWLRLLVLRQHDGSATHLCRTSVEQFDPTAPKMPQNHALQRP
jgi:hypothetical protein